MWHYLDTKCLYFRCENNSTLGVLIEEIWYLIIVYTDTTAAMIAPIFPQMLGIIGIKT